MPCPNVIEPDDEPLPCELDEEADDEDTCTQYDESEEYYDERDYLPCEEPNQEEDDEVEYCNKYGDTEPESEWEPPPFLPCEDRNASYAPSQWNSTLEENDDPAPERNDEHSPGIQHTDHPASMDTSEHTHSSAQSFDNMAQSLASTN